MQLDVWHHGTINIINMDGVDVFAARGIGSDDWNRECTQRHFFSFCLEAVKMFRDG
jgi:hypothetical protein